MFPGGENFIHVRRCGPDCLVNISFQFLHVILVCSILELRSDSHDLLEYGLEVLDDHPAHFYKVFFCRRLGQTCCNLFCGVSTFDKELCRHLGNIWILTRIRQSGNNRSEFNVVQVFSACCVLYVLVPNVIVLLRHGLTHVVATRDSGGLIHRFAPKVYGARRADLVRDHFMDCGSFVVGWEVLSNELGWLDREASAATRDDCLDVLLSSDLFMCCFLGDRNQAHLYRAQSRPRAQMRVARSLRRQVAWSLQRHCDRRGGDGARYRRRTRQAEDPAGRGASPW